MRDSSPEALASPHRRLLRVTGNERLGAYRLLRVADPEGLRPAAGQFAMLVAAEGWGGGGSGDGGEGELGRPYLARAFSVARVHAGEAQYLLEDVGPGTRALCGLEPGDGVLALGPFGRGFSSPREGRRALLVGGGVGIAPLMILQDEFERAGVAHRVLLGFRDGAHAAGAGLLSDAVLATDDGSVGHAGLVTELLAGELEGDDAHAMVYACGPARMLEAVRALCASRRTPAELALEAGMACGFGACYGCVVPARDGRYLRVCVDGPVIDAAELEHVDAHAGTPV